MTLALDIADVMMQPFLFPDHIPLLHHGCGLTGCSSRSSAGLTKGMCVRTSVCAAPPRVGI